MICHKLKCIFIHIPRTAGSSIEKCLVNKDWWKISPSTKHLLASQAKKMYAEYWNTYFKFSFVRNPYTRMSSLTTFPTIGKVYYGTSDFPNNIISEQHIHNYKKIYGSPVLIEYDHRFYNRTEVEKESHKKNCVYGNILDEPIDFVGRFETLEDDFKYICNAVGLKNKTLPNIGSNKTNKTSLSVEAKHLINEIYKEDFIKYNYRLEES
jgi:hypothetical protein